MNGDSHRGSRCVHAGKQASSTLLAARLEQAVSEIGWIVYRHGIGPQFALHLPVSTELDIGFRSVPVRTQRGRELVVRQFAGRDFQELVRMYKSFEPKRVAQGIPPPDVPRIAHWLDRLAQKSEALLAWDGDLVVAHTILCPMPDNAAEFTIFVHQVYRQEGLGTVLSRLTLAWAWEMGIGHAYLTTEASNFRALRLFRKLGFQTTSSYGDEIEMKLNLVSFDCERPRAA